MFEIPILQKPIVVYGQSLGSLIASNALSQSDVNVDAVIYEAGIYSLTQVSANALGQRWFSWPFQGLGYVLISSKYNFKKFQDDFPLIPTLLLHSKNDPIVKPKQSQRLHESIQNSCLCMIDEKTHINIGNIENGKYRKDILSFLDQLLL